MDKQRLIIDRIYSQFKNSIYDNALGLHPKQLLEFQKTEFGEASRQQDVKFNRWMYHDNSDNKCLYCVQDKRVVGHQGAIPIDLKLGDCSVKAAYAIDLRVNSDWKMRGLGVALIGTLMNQFDVLIGLGISDEAKKMFLRQGWHDLGQLSFFLKPMTLQGVASRNPSASPVEKIRNISALAYSKIVDYYQNIVARKIDLVPNSKFHQQHQELSEKLQPNSANYAIRDSDFLNWRYCRFPGQSFYEIYDYYSNSGKLDGFVVIKESFWNGKKSLKVVELICDSSLISGFLNKVVRMANERKVDIILIHCLNPVLTSKLKKHTFYQRPYGSNFMVYSNQSELNSRINEISAWQVVFGESDMDFD